MSRVAAFVLATSVLGACSPASSRPGGASAQAVARTRSPITLTYLGVAGWQITDGKAVVLVDPCFSRPQLADDAPMMIDEAAVAAHVPPRADVILVAHSHVDHMLDVPAVARLTGAEIIGSTSTARYARAAGVPAEQIIPIKGGEDYAFEGFSVRVIPSLHSALDDKHTFGGDSTIPPDPKLPMTFDELVEGGTFAYLVRIGGHEVLIISSANFIERELVGLRPDIAIVATGLREEIHDYSCRLMQVLGRPPRVFPNHFDAWRAPLVPTPPLSDGAKADLRAFADEVRGCAPSTEVVVPERFRPITVP